MLPRNSTIFLDGNISLNGYFEYDTYRQMKDIYLTCIYPDRVTPSLEADVSPSRDKYWYLLVHTSCSRNQVWEACVFADHQDAGQVGLQAVPHQVDCPNVIPALFPGFPLPPWLVVPGRHWPARPTPRITGKLTWNTTFQEPVLRLTLITAWISKHMPSKW